MASAPITGFSVLLFTFFLALSICFCDVSASVLKEDFIQQTCKSTDNYNLCVSLLQSDPHTELKSNLPGILTIFIDISINKATSNRLYVENLLKTAKDEAAKKCLNTCKENYISSISNLQESLPELKSKTYWALRMDLSKAQLGGHICQFSDSPPSSFCKSNLKSRNDDFDQLSRFSLKVVDLIDPNHKPPLV
ncbi:cell wall / vacuolar inhibitor of fructosidase 2-like [Telopea speciosissima]|uniref:cell wall / vacuolar inhibitor of fructosidase 2-like n=1 Tax=Telopea speciosissima TaxID=54955 RepID=UPI001CC6A675|nr:cell wall / vacuolar inhibitor of fructosidase 2-like [Telopea speciosissima]